MRATCLKTVVLCAMLSPMMARAQDKPPAPVLTPYKLVYRLLQIAPDGKISSSHSYSTIIAADNTQHAPGSSIRNEDKIPIPRNKAGDQGAIVTNYDYQNVGTDIDSQFPSVRDGQLNVRVIADTTTVVKSPSDASALPPVFRHLRWSSDVIVTPEKPTIIFSSDNISDTGKTELELTATEIGHH